MSVIHDTFPHRVDYAGVTLVELVISIAVIAAGITGMLLAISHFVRTSADPMIEEQAIAIAEAHLAEATSKWFSEDAANGAAESYLPLGPDAGEANRTLYDDVDDYNGLPDNVVRDQNNQAIANLAAYTVAVVVTAQPLNDIPVAPGDAKRVQVTVGHPALGINIVLTGFRTRY